MNSDSAELTSAVDKTNVSMAPEQGLSSTLDREKNNKPNASELGVSHTDLASLYPSMIYNLKKPQLVLACQKYQIDPTGLNVSDIRRLLSDAVKKRRASASTENLLQQWIDEMEREETDILIPVPTVPRNRSSTINDSKTDTGKAYAHTASSVTRSEDFSSQ